MREVRKTVVVGSIIVAIAIVSTVAWSNQKKKNIIGLRPEDIKWFTPAYYTDGRQRAQLFGNSTQDGPWIDRVKIPSGARVLAHTHPQDELVTVIEGTWSVGEGERFDAAKLKAYSAGSFIVIPAGLPHFVAAMDGSVIVQVSGTGKFSTEYLEK
jgi:quercetin dioxygenase-like cupin family protein